MKYSESPTVELKREITGEIKKEIVAFLNTHGGIIYVGVNDDGSIYYNLTEKERDIEKTKVINWLSSDIIYPDCCDFVNLTWLEDGILEISVAEGNNKPYYLTEYGLNPKGVFIRIETSKFPASKNKIKELELESLNIYYEDMFSLNQELTFNYLLNKNANLSLTALNLKIKDKYTNLGYLFSDEQNNNTKIYFVDNKNKVIKKKAFKGSILKQIDEIIKYLCPILKDSYHEEVIKEALVNAFTHRNWQLRDNIRIEVSPTKINFISPGGFFNLDFDSFNKGKTSYRNPKLVKVLKILGYTNSFKITGLKHITNICHEYNVEPLIMSTTKMFILSIPKNKKA